LTITQTWLSTGKRPRKGLRGHHPLKPDHEHAESCTKGQESEVLFARRLPAIASRAITALAISKTRSQRRTELQHLVNASAKGCRGCLLRLSAVYDPAVQSFDANFPASPTW
jgi:hypothetical protein